jgi:RNA polymerase sigma-70 factor (ECF subfamily)
VPANFSITVEEVNGTPSILVWYGELPGYVSTCEVVDGKIQALRSVLNPDKLAYIVRQLRE